MEECLLHHVAEPEALIAEALIAEAFVVEVEVEEEAKFHHSL